MYRAQLRGRKIRPGNAAGSRFCVVSQRRANVCNQIGVRDLHAAIDHADFNPLTGDPQIPRRNDVDVFARRTEKMLKVRDCRLPVPC